MSSAESSGSTAFEAIIQDPELQLLVVSVPPWAIAIGDKEPDGEWQNRRDAAIRCLDLIEDTTARDPLFTARISTWNNHLEFEATGGAVRSGVLLEDPEKLIAAANRITTALPTPVDLLAKVKEWETPEQQAYAARVHRKFIRDAQANRLPPFPAAILHERLVRARAALNPTSQANSLEVALSTLYGERYRRYKIQQRAGNFGN